MKSRPARPSILILTMAVTAFTAFAAETALDRYVKKPDPTYRYELVRTAPGEGYTTYTIDLTSQTWRTAAEVDHSVWKHWLTIVKPDKVATTTGYLFITGGFAWHVGWRDQRRKIPIRERTPDGKVTIKGTREEKVYVGPYAELVDPFDFIISTRAQDPQTADWVGHRGRYSMAQLQAMPHLDRGQLEVLRDVSSKTGNGSWLNTDEFKKARSPAERMTYLDRFAQPKGTPPFYDCVTLYMMFVLMGDGVYEECQLVVGAGLIGGAIVAKYTKYNGRRKPEMLDPATYSLMWASTPTPLPTCSRRTRTCSSF
jgi:hypothetical protein